MSTGLPPLPRGEGHGYEQYAQEKRHTDYPGRVLVPRPERVLIDDHAGYRREHCLQDVYYGYRRARKGRAEVADVGQKEVLEVLKELIHQLVSDIAHGVHDHPSRPGRPSPSLFFHIIPPFHIGFAYLYDRLI